MGFISLADVEAEKEAGTTKGADPTEKSGFTPIEDTGFTPVKGRTWGEFGKDVALSAVQGVDMLAKLPAMAYDKATTGNWYGPETQKISAMSDERERLKSEESQVKSRQKAQIAKSAGEAARAHVGEGALGTAAQVAAEFGVSFWEAAKDPASIPEFVAQQAAQLGVMGKVGRGAEVAAQGVAKAAPRAAATRAGQVAIGNAGTAAAVGTGAALQGVDVGSDTMQRLMALPDALWQENPEYVALAREIGPQAAKERVASRLATDATLKAGAVSVATAALPGGSAIERALVGKGTGLKAVPRAFAGEAGQEGAEEGSGAYFGNKTVQQIDASQDAFEGVGTAAGQGAFMGGVMGGGISAGAAMAKRAASPKEAEIEAALNAQTMGADPATGMIPAAKSGVASPSGDGGLQGAHQGADERLPRSAAVDSAPEVRLAELEILAQSRELSPVEKREAQSLVEQIAQSELEAEASPVAQTPSGSAGRTIASDRNYSSPQVDGNVMPAAAESSMESADLPGTGFIPIAQTHADTSGRGGFQIQALETNDPAATELMLPTRGQDLQRQALQNRDRSRAASVAQMADIARNPDYLRLATSRSPETGAPMVFAVGDARVGVPAENIGKTDVAVMSDGQRVPFQYAVVDASTVEPSNFADGRSNPAFAADVIGTLKALSNGRTAGLRAAYEEGTAQAYQAELMADVEAHGVPVEAIQRTPNPILVRVYSERLNTPDMATKSQGQALGMSPVELAIQDARLITTHALASLQPGDVASAANRDFVRTFIGQLQQSGLDVAGLMTADGTLSPSGRQRLQAAVMQAAYGDVELVTELFDSLDNDIKSIGEALKVMAGEWANLRDSARQGAINPAVDITGNLVQAVNLVRRARRDRVSLFDLTRQPDLMTGQTPDVITVGALRFFYGGSYFARALGRDAMISMLRDYVRSAMTTGADADMFGEQVSPDLILASFENQGVSDAKNSAEERGRTPDGRPVAGRRADEARPGKQRHGGDEGVSGVGRTGGQGPAQSGSDSAPNTRTATSLDLQALDALRREALQIARTGAFAKQGLTFEPAGDQLAVMFKGQEIARLDGARSRENIVKAIKAAIAGAAPDAAELVGDRINREWVAFSEDAGALGIPRADMPQIQAEHRGALVQFLKARGVEHEAEAAVDPATLKPTQTEFSPAKVEKAKEFDGRDRAILVSADGHVLDGHHQWMARREQGQPVRAIRFEAPMAELLPLAREFPSAGASSGATPALQEAAQATRFPSVGDIEGLNVGPAGRISPKVIAAGRPLYRETNLDGLDDLMRTDAQAEVAAFFVADNADLVQAIESRETEGGNITLLSRRDSQTETPEFKRWFGDSKVVDAEGRPLVVYHGTASEFNVFTRGRSGFFFTDDRDAAQAYADYNEDGDGEPRVVDAYLSIKNPLVLDRAWYDENVLEESGDRNWEAVDMAVADADEAGHDGLILRGFPDFAGMDGVRRIEREYDQYIAFRSEQIKSATGNRGTFDPNDPDIRMSATADGATDRLDFPKLQALAQRLKARMPNMPKVHVLEDPSKAPKALREYIIRQDAWYDVEGAMHDGELYLFASGLADEARAEHVLLEHEAAHYGLRAILGPSLKTAMRLIYIQNASVRRAVADLQKRGKLSDLVATEEVIVDIPTAELARLKGWRKVVDQVRAWLAERGYTALAERIGAWLQGTLSQQQRADLFVAELVGAARDYVAGKVPARAAVGMGTRLSGTLAEDIERQEKWLQREAQARGFKDIEDLLARDYPLFEKLAELWRKKNPAEVLLSRSPDTQAAYEARIDALFDGQKATSVTGSFQPRLAGLPGQQGRSKMLTEKNLAGYRRAQGADGARLSRAAPGKGPGKGNAWTQAKAKVVELTSPAAIDRLLYEFQDKLIDLRRMRDHIKEIGGAITDLNDAYLGEELYHKRLAKRSADFLDKELKPLLGEMRARAVSLPELEQYLHARHAPEANRVLAERNPNRAILDAKRKKAADAVRDLEVQLQQAKLRGAATAALEESLQIARDEAATWNGAQAFAGTEVERLSLSGMSDADAKAVIDALPSRKLQHMEHLAAMVDKMQGRTLDELEGYGLIDKATLNAWRSSYRFYVPLHRDEAKPESDRHPIGQGFSIKGAGTKTRVGSNEKVTNILAHIAMQREAALTRGEKNNVVKKLYLMAAQNPDSEFWALDSPPKVKSVDSRNGTVRTMVDPTYKNRPNVVMVRIAGQDRAVVFNEHNPSALRLAESMKNLDVGDLHVVLGLVSKGTRWFASVNTQYNPIFGLINFARDVQAGLLNLSTTPLAGKQKEVAKHVPTAVRAIYRQRRGKASRNTRWTALWDEFEKVGGTTGYRDLFSDADDRAKALVRDLQAMERGQVSKAAHAIVDWLSDYNEVMENAVRLSAYKVATEQGMSKEQAASLAKNLTVNFNRKGRQTRWLGALFAFFNAALQGTARMVETLRGPAGKRIMFGGVALGMINTLIGMAMMGAGDDDEADNWEKIPEFVKERSIVIPLGREDYLAIPMPLGFHVLPNIGRLAVESAFAEDGKSIGRRMGEMLSVVIDAFNPLGGTQNMGQMVTPTVLDPVVALWQNRDWTGRPIYREDFSDSNRTPGFTRTKDSASTLSKSLAEAINSVTGGSEYRQGFWSPTPDQLDYVFGQLTGGLGREMIKVNQSLSATVTGNELPPHKVPLLGRLYGNTRGTAGQSGQYYENLRQINEVEGELKGRWRKDDAPQEFERREPLTGAVELAKQVESRIRVLRRERSELEQDKPAGYQERKRQIDAEIAMAMTDLNNKVTRLRKEAKDDAR